MFHSVRARLTLWYTAILALVLAAFCTISYVLLENAIRSATDASLAGTARELAPTISGQPAGGVPGRLDLRFSDRAVLLFAAGGRLVESSPSHLTPGEREHIRAAVLSGLDGFATSEGGSEGDGIRLFAFPVRVGGRPHVVVVAQDLDPQADRLEAALRAIGLGVPLALLIAAGGGYLLARKSLAPVTAMSAEAREIGAATLGARIVVKNERDELGFLATTLNDLLGRLQRSFDSQRSFMADASHELRTPVAIIQGEADVALTRPRSSTDYRESIEIMQKAARKLTRVVEDLFLLARSDAGSYPMVRSRFYLEELLADCVRSMKSLAEAKGIELRCEAPQEAILFADEDLIQRMLLTLLDNAIKFTPAGGQVVVRAEREGRSCVIRVSDSGPGIRPEDEAHLFERFFRAERARGTQHGRGSGAGLGLAIGRWIAEAHGGTLTLERSEQGATFAARLPAEAEEMSAAN
jgi:two-component system, OmpR family, sensor kinase